MRDPSTVPGLPARHPGRLYPPASRPGRPAACPGARGNTAARHPGPCANPAGDPHEDPPRYAPPPGAACYWDNTLGVYVLEGRGELYYRERTYYRWDGGWSWSMVQTAPGSPPTLPACPPGWVVAIRDLHHK